MKMGFSTIDFVKPVDPNLICGICSGVLDAPTLTPCGHTFCESCINTWLDTANVSNCPECRSGMDKSSVRPILSLRNFILRLEVTCPNKLRGCKKLVAFESLEAHENMCLYAAVVCDTCQQHVDKYQLPEHRANCLALRSTKGQEETSPLVEKDSSPSSQELGMNTEKISKTFTSCLNLRLFSRVHRFENGPASFTNLLQRITNLEKKVGLLLDDLHIKNSSLYYQDQGLKEHSSERLLKENSINHRGTNVRLPFHPDYSPTECLCQQDIAKLSLHIARYLLQKPPSLDSEKVFCAIRKYYEMQSYHTGANSNTNHDIHMLLVTAYSSNWFTGVQRILLGCWLQRVLRNQDVRKCLKTQTVVG